MEVVDILHTSNYIKKIDYLDDEHLFVTTLIPLQLSSQKGEILWYNRTPQSTRFCRPIKLQLIKESKEVILQNKIAFEEQIKNLDQCTISLEDKIVHVHFKLYLTLIDGKVLNIIMDTKSMPFCPFCHATSKSFNNLSNINTDKFSTNSSLLQYGLSPLHAWIRI